MEFFETVMQVASDVATASAKQSKKLYIIAKLRLQIIEKQNIVKNLRKQIGKDAYEAYMSDSDIVGAIEKKLKKIQLLEENMDVLRRKIEFVKTQEDEINLDEIDFDETEDEFYEDIDSYEEDEEESYDEEDNDGFDDDDENEDIVPLY